MIEYGGRAVVERGFSDECLGRVVIGTTDNDRPFPFEACEGSGRSSIHCVAPFASAFVDDRDVNHHMSADVLEPRLSYGLPNQPVSHASHVTVGTVAA